MIELQVLLQRTERALKDFMLLQPKTYTLSQVALMCGKDADTIRKHLISHYKQDRDYFQKKKNGIIHIETDAVLSIRRYYA